MTEWEEEVMASWFRTTQDNGRPKSVLETREDECGSRVCVKNSYWNRSIIVLKMFSCLHSLIVPCSPSTLFPLDSPKMLFRSYELLKHDTRMKPVADLHHYSFLHSSRHDFERKFQTRVLRLFFTSSHWTGWRKSFWSALYNLFWFRAESSTI